MQMVQVGLLSFYVSIFVKQIKEIHWFVYRKDQADPGDAGSRHPSEVTQELPASLSSGQHLWVGFILKQTLLIWWLKFHQFSHPGMA